MDRDTFERISALELSDGVDRDGKGALFDTYSELKSAHATDIDVQLTIALRAKYPDLTLTTIPANNVNLLAFARAGYATATLDEDDEVVLRWTGFIPPSGKPGSGGRGHIGDAITYAKYRYTWSNEDFLLYTVVSDPIREFGIVMVQYVLAERRDGEKVQGHSQSVDALIRAIGELGLVQPEALYVFDRYWYRSVEMWEEVQKASWEKVILDPHMKEELVSVCDTFFGSRDVYKELGVAWKRGLVFHGPPGNGKTISIKALMHSMYERKEKVPCLYVKSAPSTYNISAIFSFARTMAPCLLIFEDIDTIVTPNTRAYFFNEVDGIANNDGIMMIASTNYLDRLDPGLVKRPSRFDRKYLFPLPDKDQRTLYAEFWRKKLQGRPIDFPEKLCPAISDLTDGFSFAYMQELFVASLLAIARGETGLADGPDKDGSDLSSYRLYRVIKKQAAILRADLESSRNGTAREDAGREAKIEMMGDEAEPHGEAERHIPCMTPRGGPMPLLQGGHQAMHFAQRDSSGMYSGRFSPVHGRRMALAHAGSGCSSGECGSVPFNSWSSE